MSKLLLSLLSLFSLVACTSTKSPADIYEIQETQGFFSHELNYHGSDTKYHYFSRLEENYLHFSAYRSSIFRAKRSEITIKPELMFKYEVNESYVIVLKVTENEPRLAILNTTKKSKQDPMIKRIQADFKARIK